MINFISSQKLLTVLMVNYNGMPPLVEAIESILSQSYTNFDFLIVDDGSTDTSCHFIKKINDKRIRLIQLSHQGITKSLNHGLDLINTKYTAIMDSDDISESNRLEYQIHFMENNQEFGLLGTHVKYFVNSQKRIWYNKLPTQDYFIKRDLLKGYTPISHSSIIFRTELVKSIGGYNQKSEPIPDYDLFIRLLPLTKFCNLSSVYNFTRLSKKSYTQTNYRKMMRSVYLLKKKKYRKKIDLNILDITTIYLHSISHKLYKLGLLAYLERKWLKGIIFLLFSGLFDPLKSVRFLKNRLIY